MHRTRLALSISSFVDSASSPPSSCPVARYIHTRSYETAPSHLPRFEVKNLSACGILRWDRSGRLVGRPWMAHLTEWKAPAKPGAGRGSQERGQNDVQYPQLQGNGVAHTIPCFWTFDCSRFLEGTCGFIISTSKDGRRGLWPESGAAFSPGEDSGDKLRQAS